jgi:hypothetical protein
MHRCTRILHTRGGTAGGLSGGELIDNPNTDTPPIGRTARTTSGLPRTERSIFRTLRGVEWVREYAAQIGIGELAPHDLRRYAESRIMPHAA